MQRIFATVVWWALAAALLAAAPARRFQAPADASPPFRREALPLDTDTMGGLSRQLTGLGCEAGGSSDPAKRRAGAQLLALAAALDPANRQARESAKQLAGGGKPALPETKQLASARSRAWQTWAWLASEEAGADGQALGACLGDALAVVDPGHPKAETLRQQGEKGRWQGWVAPPAAFGQTPAPPPAKQPDDTAGTTGETPPPGPPDTAKEGARLWLKEARAAMPLYYYDSSKQRTESGVCAARLNAWTAETTAEGSEEDGHQSFGFRIAGVEDMSRLAASRDALLAAVEAARGKLPAQGHASLSFGDKINYSVGMNDDSYTGPAAVLLDAVLSGKEPAKDLIVFGAIRKDGVFALPRRPWERLRLMEAGSSGRLLVPKEAADLLVGLLVLEKPDFFLNHEVLAAADYRELTARAGVPDQGPLADAMAKFAEIRRVGQGKPAAQFAAHPSTRQRLSEVAQLCPDHLSARMLLVQGSGKRPTTFTTPILAREIRRAITPMAWANNTSNSWDLKADKLDATHATCRAQLDALTNWVDRPDRPLHDEALQTVNMLRTLARRIRNPEPDPYNGSSSHHDRVIVPLQRQMAAAYGTLMEKIDQITGEDDYQPPKPQGQQGGQPPQGQGR